MENESKVRDAMECVLAICRAITNGPPPYNIELSDEDYENYLFHEQLEKDD